MAFDRRPEHVTDDVAVKVLDALRRPRWSPPDPTLWAMLSSRDAEEHRQLVRWGMIVAVASYIAYGAFDYFLFPDVAYFLILTRLGLGLAFLTALEMAIRADASTGTLHLIAATAIVTGSVGWLGIAVLTEHHQALSYFIMFGIIFILGANLFFNFRFWLSAVSSTVITVAFIVAITLRLDLEIYIRVVLATLLANCLVSSLYLSWRLGIERYRRFLNALLAQFQEQTAIANGEKLVEMANTDPLTGLKNRRAIEREFEAMRKDWLTREHEIGLILIDVDHFKRYNDYLGHHAGDEALVSLAQVLCRTATSHGAVAGRYGGEEFIILCRVAGKADLADFADTFCQAIRDRGLHHPDRGDDQSIITISAGASITRTDRSSDFEILLQEADRALYVSKFAGRDRSTVFEVSSRKDQSGNSLEALLSVAIEKNLLSVVYQPVFEVGSEVLVGYETLMRLRDEGGKSISPSVFIPVAERDGSIVDLGFWVIERACRDMAENALTGKVAVNVSGVQLRTPHFALRVADILERYRLNPARLVIEITEGTDIMPEAQSVRAIEQLKAMGVAVWLDDFGTGYAGLAWLRRLPFDLVKIDRTFLHDCDTKQGLRLLQDMIQLLQNSGHRVLVEGVETAEQKLLLHKLGVNLMQGFHIGMPESLERVVDVQETRPPRLSISA